MRLLSRTTLAFILLLFIAGVARADQIVYFKSGRVIVASAVEERGGWVFLEFLGGGLLGVPGIRVERIEESDLVSETTASVGNTIQAPDPSRRTGGGRNTAQGRPFRPEAAGARNNPGGNRAVPNSLPGANRMNRGGAGQNQDSQQRNQNQFGLQGTDLSGNVNQPQRNPDDRKDDK
jgi:hypothetical protein